MTGEYLTLETAKKLRSREKAIKELKDIIEMAHRYKMDYVVLMSVEKILRILEG